MRNFILEQDSSICICINFLIKDEKLEPLNRTLAKELGESEISQKELKNFLINSNHYLMEHMEVLFYLRTSNYQGFNDFHEKQIRQTAKEMKKQKMDEKLIKSEIEGIKIRRDRLVENEKETHGYIRLMFTINEKIEYQSLLKLIDNFREKNAFMIIEESIDDFWYHICVSSRFDIEKYSLLSSYSTISKTKQLQKIDEEIGEFSLRNIDWEIEKSPLGVSGLSIGTIKNKLNIELRMCYETKKISQINDNFRTSLEIINTIIKEKGKDE